MSPQARVLIVEEARPSREALSRLLGREGLTVSEAADRDSALDVLAEGDVDLVLVAHQLNGVGGVEAVRRLRGELRGELFVPVAVLCERDDKATRLAALQAGADGVLERPMDDEELLARVQALLRLKQQHDRLRTRLRDLERLSITDELTGLYNRRYFQERLREEFRRAQRYDDPVSLIMIDLDHFKEVNDRRGHVVGDSVLRQTARVLPRCVRETDFVTRYGGEEFAIILPKTHLSGCLTVAERLWREVRDTVYKEEGETVRLTASIGVSSFPNKGVASADDLLRTADDALYEAKRNGRDRVCLHQHVSYFLAPEAAAAKR